MQTVDEEINKMTLNYSTLSDPEKNSIFEEYINSLNELQKKKPNNPKCIFLYGPPASGKSSMLTFLKKELEIDDEITIEQNVDAIISRIPRAKRKIEDCKKKLNEDYSRSNILNCRKDYLINRNVGNDLSKKVFDYSIENNYNIISETMGVSLVVINKFLIPKLIEKGYSIYVYYPIVSFDRIKRRLESRGKYEGRTFDHNDVLNFSKLAQKNIKDLIINKNIKNVLLYDNDNDQKKDPLVILDVKNNEIDINSDVLKDPNLEILYDYLKEYENEMRAGSARRTRRQRRTRRYSSNGLGR